MAAVEPRRRFPTSLVALGVVVLTGFLFIGWVKDLVPGLGNPFGSETVDRSRPAVLKSIENLRDFRAASGHFEVIVDVEQDARFVPAKIKGEEKGSSSERAARSTRASTSPASRTMPSRSRTTARASRSSCRPPRSVSLSSTSNGRTSTTVTVGRSTGSSHSSATTSASSRISTRSQRRSSPTPRATAPGCWRGPSGTRG
jgi:hypothetical protein